MPQSFEQYLQDFSLEETRIVTLPDDSRLKIKASKYCWQVHDFLLVFGGYNQATLVRMALALNERSGRSYEIDFFTIVSAAHHPQIINKKFSKLTCSDTAIYQCGTVLSSASFSAANFDVKEVAYEQVIRGTFDKSDHQQFFTPHQIVSFMVAFLQPFLKGVIADPACGTAGFLAEIVRSKIFTDMLIGLEIDDRLTWVSGINLLLHGTRNFETLCLTEGGTLGPQAANMFSKVDAILTNPPFGSDFSDAEALQTFDLGRGRQSRRRGILFIERCWSLLKKEGVLGIIIDEGILNLPSAVDVRKFILRHFDILAIVSLPETAFMPYANVNASILFLRKTSAANRSQKVFLVEQNILGVKPMVTTIYCMTIVGMHALIAIFLRY